jgi:hypothetical protein
MVVESLLICIPVYVFKSRRIPTCSLGDVFLERSCVDGKSDQLLQSGCEQREVADGQPAWEWQ